MNIGQSMKRNVVSTSDRATIRDAAAVFVQNHIGLLPIVDQDNKLVGAVTLRDMLSLELPDFINFVADVDFVRDFGAVETTRPPADVLDRSIKTLMHTVITVQESSGLLRAYALMLQNNLLDILVVSEDGKLTGVASRVDIGSTILSTWSKVE